MDHSLLITFFLDLRLLLSLGLDLQAFGEVVRFLPLVERTHLSGFEPLSSASTIQVSRVMVRACQLRCR